VSKYVGIEALKKLIGKSTLTSDEATLIWRILNVEFWYREFIPHQSRPIENPPKYDRLTSEA